MANYIYAATSLIGSAENSLDSIDGVDLTQSDAAIVFTPSTTYFYTLVASSGAIESSPDIIMPDSNAGDKRWILSKTDSTSVINIDEFTEVGGVLVGTGENTFQEEAIIRHITKTTTSTLTANEVRNTIIDNYGQDATAIVLTLLTPGPLMATTIQISNKDNSLDIKSGVGDAIILDGTELTVGAQIHLASQVVGDFITLWTIRTGVTEYKWVAVSGPNDWVVV